MKKRAYKKLIFILGSTLIFVMVLAPVEFKWSVSLFAMMATLMMMVAPRFKHFTRKHETDKKEF